MTEVGSIMDPNETAEREQKRTFIEKARWQRLAKFRWSDAPILTPIFDEAGFCIFSGALRFHKKYKLLAVTVVSQNVR
jgi:hypothetical protein